VGLVVAGCGIGAAAVGGRLSLAPCGRFLADGARAVGR
jgi:hypothetical protein